MTNATVTILLILINLISILSDQIVASKPKDVHFVAQKIYMW